MPELVHSALCTCQDCRGRRLLREDERRADRYSADELEDFGFVLPRRKPSQDDD